MLPSHPVSFTDFAAYVALFPQLVAGPIVRYQTVAGALVNRSHTVTGFASGAALFILGFAKKILVANPLGRIADAAFGAQALGAADGWWAGGRPYCLLADGRLFSQEWGLLPGLEGVKAISGAQRSVIALSHAPFADVPPAGTNLPTGGRLVLSVQARSSTPLSYQWEHEGDEILAASGQHVRAQLADGSLLSWGDDVIPQPIPVAVEPAGVFSGYSRSGIITPLVVEQPPANATVELSAGIHGNGTLSEWGLYGGERPQLLQLVKLVGNGGGAATLSSRGDATWTPLETVQPSGSVVLLRQPRQPAKPHCFYRLVQPRN